MADPLVTQDKIKKIQGREKNKKRRMFSLKAIISFHSFLCSLGWKTLEDIDRHPRCEYGSCDVSSFRGYKDRVHKDVLASCSIL